MINYFVYSRESFKNALAHRSSLIIWFLTKPLAMFVSVAVWTTIFNYSGAGVIGGLTKDAMISYMLFNIVIGNLVYTDINRSLPQMINRGSLGTSLLKPVKYYYSQLFGILGWKSFDIFIQTIPATIIGILLFSFHGSSIINIIIASASVVLAFLINYWYSLIWGLVGFKTEFDAWSLGWLKDFTTSFLSGAFISLTLLPGFFFNALLLTPFPYINFVPAMIFVGNYSLAQSLISLGVQVFWVIVIQLIAVKGFNYALKNYSGAGS